MFRGSLNQRILKLAIPFIFANISVPLLSLVDTAMMGHLDSEKYLGAIAMGGLIFNFVFWGFGFLKMGTTGFTAQALGRKQQTECTLILYRGFFLAIATGTLLILLQTPIWNLSELLMTGSDEVIHYAKEYYYIRIYSAPAVFLLYVLIGWFLGMQNALYVLYIMIVENLSNVIFNIIFVYGFHKQSEGVALGTVFAQYLALVFAMSLLFITYKEYLKNLSVRLIFQTNRFLDFLKANSDIMIRTMSLMFVFAFFMNQSSSINDTVLAANMILLQFVTLYAYFTDAFAHAGETLAGFFLGAGKMKALMMVIKKLFIWTACLSLIFSLSYIFLFHQYIRILTSQNEVIKIAFKFRYWMAAIPLLAFTAYIWDGLFIGVTQTRKLRNSMLISLFLVFLPAYYLGLDMFEKHAIWFAFALFMASRSIILSFYSINIFRQNSN